jgi:hypothetical protein
VISAVRFEQESSVDFAREGKRTGRSQKKGFMVLCIIIDYGVAVVAPKIKMPSLDYIKLCAFSLKMNSNGQLLTL